MNESKGITTKLRGWLGSGTKMRRFGCVVVSFIWFALLLSPCFLIVLATQGEITIQLGNVPGQVIRIWLVEGAKERGIAISRPSVVLDTAVAATCVQTDTSFMLWMGRAEAIRFCECYTETNESWSLIGSHSGMCVP